MKKTLFLLLFAFPLLAKAADNAELRLMSFNIWGDYFKNPVQEREKKVADVILRYSPDVVLLQEVTKAWAQSPVYTALPGYKLAPWKEKWNNYVPVLYKAERLELLASDSELFHLMLDPSKGFSWGLFLDKKTGGKFYAGCTHYWWQNNGKESDFIRVYDSQRILATLAKLRAETDAPALFGGDLNSRLAAPCLKHLRQNGWETSYMCALESDDIASHHGNPVRDAQNVYRGKRRPQEDTITSSIDHIFLESPRVHVLHHKVVVDQDALDASDHSPIYIDFVLRQ